MSREEAVKDYSIYVVFISTNTNMGKMIRLLTHNKYSHVAIAFNGNLHRMYSFARYHINSPILGGFVTEKPLRYLYDNQDVAVKICEMPIRQEEYNRIDREVKYFSRNSEEMIYNTVNAVLSLMGKRLYARNMYTCLEFVTYLLRYPEMTAISELENRLKDYVIYRGSLREMLAWEQEDITTDEFFCRRGAVGVIADTVCHIRRVAGGFFTL